MPCSLWGRPFPTQCMATTTKTGTCGCISWGAKNVDFWASILAPSWVYYLPYPNWHMVASCPNCDHPPQLPILACICSAQPAHVSGDDRQRYGGVSSSPGSTAPLFCGTWIQILSVSISSWLVRRNSSQDTFLNTAFLTYLPRPKLPQFHRTFSVYAWTIENSTL